MPRCHQFSDVRDSRVSVPQRFVAAPGSITNPCILRPLTENMFLYSVDVAAPIKCSVMPSVDPRTELAARSVVRKVREDAPGTARRLAMPPKAVGARPRSASVSGCSSWSAPGSTKLPGTGPIGNDMAELAAMPTNDGELAIPGMSAKVKPDTVLCESLEENILE